MSLERYPMSASAAEVPIALVECVLDILVALNLARREGDIVTADKGLLPLFTPPRKAFFLGNLKSNYELGVKY
jgi:hypothetical protein